ncbi:MAG TPA: rhomboid family intramembrane serine protease [Thermoanaerobaculaceae bacterium]|nr:rhomboid family intramembrane serine protease [Thermoanaerobaculaceae bacterium]
MLKRQRSGSVVCPSCGRLVGVNDEKCLSCGRRNPGMWGFAGAFRRLGQDFGFAAAMTGGCLVLYLVSLVLDPSHIFSGGITSLLSPTTRSLFVLGASGAIPVFGLGRWWTVLSASWLHGGPLHILFNVLWIRQLAPETAQAYGPARMVIIYTAAGATGFLLSSLVGRYLGFLPRFLGGAGFTVGASAPIFGLLGAIVHYGRRRGSSAVGKEALGYAVVLGLFGFVMPGIDNWAHLGGFAGGYGIARWLDPWRDERVDHVVVAFACLAATALAVAASVLTGLPALGAN